ncbi:MAG: polymerase sigma factor, sigma-70 family [Herbinix sp.]|nr:polymerase sigma factor, sigma-70 family [Herbinix sp.]
MLYGDDNLLGIHDDTSFTDDLMLSDEYNDVFYALHTLSSMYRDILVDYYVHDLSVIGIAKQYGVSVETIKWRLHAGREKVKERFQNMNKTYEKVKMHIMCNGSFQPNQYLCNQIYKAVASVCYEGPLTVEEISIATGIPTLYLDETLNYMVYGDALEKIGNKYQTNFIIVHDKDNKKMQENLQPIVNTISRLVWNSIENNYNQIKDIDFYGNHFKPEQLGHILVPEIIRGTSNKIKQMNSKLTPPNRPVRNDGGNGWFVVTEGIDRIDENYSGCNTYVYPNEKVMDNLRAIYYWVGDTFDEKLSIFLKDFNLYLNKMDFNTGEFLSAHEDEIALLMSYRIIEKKNGSYYSTIPLLHQDHFDKLHTMLSACYDAIIKDLETWMLSLLQEFHSFTPKRLRDQILGNVDSYSFNATALVIKELQNTGKIMSSQLDEVFTANVFVVNK